ncbi:hypothetical protein LXL04_020468 [Taraxacum kok-saghyz]
MNILKPKPNLQQLLRDWQRRLRQETRNIDRQIRDIQREEKNVQKAIREAAKRNDMGSAKMVITTIINVNSGKSVGLFGTRFPPVYPTSEGRLNISRNYKVLAEHRK